MTIVTVKITACRRDDFEVQPANITLLLGCMQLDINIHYCGVTSRGIAQKSRC